MRGLPILRRGLPVLGLVRHCEEGEERALSRRRSSYIWAPETQSCNLALLEMILMPECMGYGNGHCVNIMF